MSIKGIRVELFRGDLTEMTTEAIINPANDKLILGGGVAGAIRRKGGPSIQEECDRIGGTFVGGAEITTGGDLKAKYVIHAVGPRMGEGDEDNKLNSAVRNSLMLAENNGIRSIAFPAISTGIFGFPKERCARIMKEAIMEHFEKVERSSLEEVYICLFDEETYRIFEPFFN